MKNFFLTLLLILCPLTSTLANADRALEALNEGIPGEIPQAQITEVLQWAQTSKFVLENLMKNTEELPRQERLHHLLKGINEVVVKSAPRNSELYLRYILNRARVLQETIEKVSGNEDWVSLDARIVLMEESIKLAISKYYRHDLQLLNKEKFSGEPFTPSQFGIDYAQFLLGWSKSILNQTAQYQVDKLIVTFLRWDLMRDPEKARFAANIALLQTVHTPEIKDREDKNIVLGIRLMKKVIHQALSIPEKTVISMGTSTTKVDFSKWDKFNLSKKFSDYSIIKVGRKKEAYYQVVGWDSSTWQPIWDSREDKLYGSDADVASIIILRAIYLKDIKHLDFSIAKKVTDSDEESWQLSVWNGHRWLVIFDTREDNATGAGAVIYAIKKFRSYNIKRQYSSYDVSKVNMPPPAAYQVMGWSSSSWYTIYDSREDNAVGLEGELAAIKKKQQLMGIRN